MQEKWWDILDYKKERFNDLTKKEKILTVVAIPFVYVFGLALLGFPFYIFSVPGNTDVGKVFKLIGCGFIFLLLVASLVFAVIKKIKNKSFRKDCFELIIVTIVLTGVILLQLSFVFYVFLPSSNYSNNLMLAAIIDLLIGGTFQLARITLKVTDKSINFFKEKWIAFIFLVAIVLFPFAIAMSLDKTIDKTIADFFLNSFFTLLALSLICYCINTIINFSDFNNKNTPILRIIFFSLSAIVFSVLAINGWFDERISTGIIAVLSGVIGGGLTLLGVAWTIRNENEKSKKADKIKNMPTLNLSSYKPENLLLPSIAFIISKRTKIPFDFYLENIGEASILGIKITSNEHTYEPSIRKSIKKGELFEIKIFDSFKIEKMYRLHFSNMMNQWYALDIRFYKKNSKIFIDVLREKIYFYKHEAGTEIVELEK